MFLNESRREYTKHTFDALVAADDPFKQFDDWFAYATKHAVFEPNAMHVSTVSESGAPKNRVVLLKSYDHHGFVFFTNYHSQKGQDLLNNPAICLTFFWPNIERQVRIEGVAQKADDALSDAYFNTRPRESQLSAWASYQSKPVASRDELEAQLTAYDAKFADTVPRPDWWGGYVVKPHFFEFWQGRKNRYHDRICYELTNTTWGMVRLSP